MKNSLSLRLNLTNVSYWIFVFSVIATQFSGLKTISYVMLWVGLSSLGVMSLKYQVVTSAKVAWFFVIIFFILYHVRPESFGSGGSYLDFLAFAPSIGVVVFSNPAIIEKRIDFYRAIVLSTLLVGIILILNDIYHFLPPTVFEEHYAGIRWVGGFDGPNELAQFCVLVVAISYGLFRERHIGIVGLSIVCSILAFIIFHTYSRGGVLALALATFIFFCWPRPQKRVAVILVIMFAVAFLYSGELFNAIGEFERVRVQANDRSDIVSAVMDIFAEKPLFGGGFGYFAESTAISAETPHSDFLVFLVSGGILSLTLLLLFFTVTVWWTIKKEMVVETYFLLVFIFNGLTWNNLIRFRISIIFFIVMLFIMSSYLDLQRRRLFR